MAESAFYRNNMYQQFHRWCKIIYWHYQTLLLI